MIENLPQKPSTSSPLPLNQSTPNPPSIPIPTKPSKAPIAIMAIVTILSLLLSGYLAFQNSQLKQAANPQPSLTPLSTPSPSPVANDPTSLTWKNEQWFIAGNFEEFPIPNVTYQINFPDTWSFNKNITKGISTECFNIKITDPTNIISLTIDAICTGWGSNDDKITLPKEFFLVKKNDEILNGMSNFRYLVRINGANETSTYIEGNNSLDDLKNAHFTNAVLITENIAERDTHSYFQPSSILMKYSGDTELQENYIQIIDKIISSLKMAKVDFEK